MKKAYLFTLITIILVSSCKIKRQISWDLEKLNLAMEFSEQIGTFAFILSTNDTIIAAWGDTVTPSSLHSARKSISSTIYAIYTGKDSGQLDLDKSLAELKIDDYPMPLTDLQKQAKIIHLIKSTSGINHAAAGETTGMRNDKNQVLGIVPNIPGTKWAYNNWDYNTLISIFEQQTGISEQEAFLKNIAFPLQMKDITSNTVEYSKDTSLSSHSIIQYNLSARDMHKFGILCLKRGNWNGRQIIPDTYYDNIVTDYTLTGLQGLRSGHGYMWWVPYDKGAREFGFPKGTFYADGMGYQQIIIIPAWETVIVHKSNTNYLNGFYMWLDQQGFTRSDSVYIMSNLQVLQDEFLDFVVNQCKDTANADNPICESCKLIGDADYQRLLTMILEARN